MVLVETLRLNCMSNQTGSPQACAPALAAWFSAPVPQPVDLVGSQRNHGPAPRPGRREPGLPNTSDAEDRCSRGRHMRTLQERTCARDRALCLRQIHTSERQRAPYDIEARALVVGPAATVRRCRGQSGRPRRPSRRPRHAEKKCCCEEPGARCRWAVPRCGEPASPGQHHTARLLFLNVSNVRVHLSEVPLFERRQANTSTEDIFEVNKEPGKLMQRFESL